MIVYLLGHSGVGKSSAVDALRAARPDVLIVDLDVEFRGREFSWIEIQPRLTALEKSDGPQRRAVVDVGAGTQTLNQLVGHIGTVSSPALVVTAPPEEVIHRQPIRGRQLDEFIATEYTSRRALFALATVTVDVGGMGAAEAVRVVGQALVDLLDGGESGEPQS